MGGSSSPTDLRYRPQSSLEANTDQGEKQGASQTEREPMPPGGGSRWTGTAIETGVPEDGTMGEQSRPHAAR